MSYDDDKESHRPYKQRVVDGRLVPVRPMMGVNIRDIDVAAPVNSGYLPMKEQDAFHATLVPNVSRSVIRSVGRQQPLHQQSSIVITVCARKTEYDRRSRIREEDWIADLGERGDHTIQPGDLVFKTSGMMANHPMQPRKRLNTIHNFGEFQVSSTVNGVHKRDKWQAVGFAVTVSNASDMNSDIALTVLVFGTYTFVNTGPQSFVPGDLVRVSLTPYVYYDGGKMFPAIEQEGVPKMKFRPAVYPYNSTTMKTLGEKAAEHAVQSLVEFKGSAPDEQVFFDKAEEACRQFNRVAFLDGTDHPIHMYLRYAIAIATIADITQYRNVLKRIWELEISRSNIKSGNLFLELATPPELEESSKEEQLMMFQEKRKAAMLIEQDHELRGQIIGTCLNRAASGQPIDIMVNVR